jgi:hypothetical protein
MCCKRRKVGKSYKILVRGSERKRPLDKPKRRQDLRRVGFRMRTVFNWLKIGSSREIL